MSELSSKLHAIHDGLSRAGVAHAFGGAIALAYCTLEPRGTRDIDVNVFVDVADIDRVCRGLPPEITIGASAVEAIERDGQARLWWDGTPVDVFFDVQEFHRQVPLGVREVPFVGRVIPVLGCNELAVFKAMFNRTRDWADIEAMVDAGVLDPVVTLGWMARLLGPDDPATARLAALLH